MSSEIKPDKAINFLSLVRKDLAGIQPPNNSHNNRNSGSTIVTPRSGEFAVDTWVEQPDDAPTVLGRFEIIEQVGEGGFARVFWRMIPTLIAKSHSRCPSHTCYCLQSQSHGFNGKPDLPQS